MQLFTMPLKQSYLESLKEKQLKLQEKQRQEQENLKQQIAKEEQHLEELRKEKSCERCESGGAMNKTVYQEIMECLGSDFMIAMTEKGKPGYYDDLIKQIIIRVAAVEPGIQQKVKVEDVLKLVQDPACHLLTGKEDPDMEDKEEEEYDRLDIRWTFKPEDLTEEVKDLVSKCFNSLSDSHENLRQAFQHATKLTQKILAPGLGLLLEALASGSMIIKDAGVYKAMKEAQMV